MLDPGVVILLTYVIMRAMSSLLFETEWLKSTSSSFLAAVVFMVIGTGCSVAGAPPLNEGSSPELPIQQETDLQDTDSEEAFSDETCPDAESCFALALADLRENRQNEAVRRLNDIRNPFQDSPWAARAAFVLGRLALEEPDGDAVELLEQALALKEVRNYVYFYQAEAYRQQGALPRALEIYEKILTNPQISPLRKQALFYKAATMKDNDQCLPATQAFEAFLMEFDDDDDLAPEALMEAGHCYLEMERPVPGINAFRRVWSEFPVHPLSKEAERKIREMEDESFPVPEVTPSERNQRAENLYMAARYPEALEEYRILSQHPDHPYWGKATFRLARTYIKLRRYREARETLTEFLEESPDSPEALDALYWLGRLAIRLGNEALLLKTEKEVSQRFPRSHNRAHLLVFMGDFFEGRNRPDKALDAYQRVLTDYENDPMVREALWRIGWMAYRDGRYEDVIETFSPFVDTESGGDNSGQFRYWAGRAAEKLERPSDAFKAYQNVCHEVQRTYYCQMARERIRRLTPELDVAQASDSGLNPGQHNNPSDLFSGKPPDILLGDSGYLAAKELLILGFNHEASRELEFLGRRYASDRAALLEISKILYGARDYHRSLRILRLSFQELLRVEDRTKPNEFWEQVFPLSAVEDIRKLAPPGSADPYIVAAVMREESAFDPEALSVAGAVGLMQLMPATASWVALQLEEESFGPEQLYDPAVNIRLGSWYLGFLARRFDGDLVPTISSYNAGPDAVSRWARHLPAGADSWDEFIESIPFSETRAFTKRVLRSYTEYLRLAQIDPAERYNRPIFTP